MASSKPGERGTIKPSAAFNAAKDVQALRDAIEGLGTTEKVLIDVLTQRSSAQRQLICGAYREGTGRGLKEDLEGDTGGHFRDLMVALVTPPDAYDAEQVYKALDGPGTDECVLIEIFASRSNQQIKALSDVFFKENKKQLIDALKSNVSGDFSKALLLLAKGERDESSAVNEEQAKQEAKILFEAGEKKLGTNEIKFIEIICQRSSAQLRQTLAEYKKISGKTLQQSIEGEMSGDLEKLLLAVVKCVQSVPAYFAERLRESVKGGGTDEPTLTRVMVSRSETDLLDVRAEFKRLYGSSLHSAIQSDVSGDYGDCVKAICGGDD